MLRRSRCAQIFLQTIVWPATYSKSKDQPGKVANPARRQLNRENEYSLSTFVPENLVSRDGFGSLVPRQPAHLHTQAESGAYLRNSSRVPRRRPFIYINRHTPSVQSRVYRVTQLRTDDVHRRYFQHAHFIPIVGVGEREANINWSMVNCQGSTRSELP